MITRHGKAVVALVRADRLQQLERLRSAGPAGGWRGSLVVWDVDLLSHDVVRVYRADPPTAPAVYRGGRMGEAEPAVPGWRMPVDELFE